VSPLREAGLLLGSYLLGCFCIGYYLVRLFRREDVREQGSGATGAANVRRLLGLPGFLLTVAGDAGKGALAVWWSHHWGGSPWLPVAALLAVVAGHLWPIQLRFRGGKGAATAIGGMLALDFPLTAGLLGLFLAVLALLRRFTFAGLVVIALSPLLAVAGGRPPRSALAVLLVAALVLIGHRANLREFIVRRRRTDPGAPDEHGGSGEDPS
jgi:acyl phosphate:glycerol-3-phosphate acyltransferase